MSAPKSVVKIDKDGVKYVSNVEFCNYTIMELTRAALRDVGKLIKRRFRENYYQHFTKRTGNAGKVTYGKVWASDNTWKPRLEIGLPHSKPGKSVKGFYGYFQEVGSSKQQKLGLLQKSVNDNIADIVAIESQYLTALRDEAEALAMIDSEKDYVIEEDE